MTRRPDGSTAVAGRGVRARAAAMIAVGAALVAAPFIPTASAQDVEFIGYLGLADSDAVTQTGGDPSQLGYPQVQAKTAHTFSSLDTGANGLALASTQWPGELAGNAGGLAQVFGAPEESAVLNYPVRAEASTVGPAESSQPGMIARVQGPLAEAIATSGGFDGGGSEFLSFGDARTVSRSELVDGVLVVTATAVVTDIDIGGAITIDSVETVAIARSDGTGGSREGRAVVSGLEIAGQPARVDEDGVHAGDDGSDNPADAVSQVVIDQVLSNFEQAFQVRMFMSAPRERDDGAIQEYRSGSLVIDLVAGDPQAGQGGDGTLAIGGSNAYAQATAGTPFSATPAAAPASVATDDAAPPPDPPAAPELFEPSPVVDSIASPAPVATSDPSGFETAAPAVLESIPIVDRFSGLGFTMPLFLLVGGLLAGRGLIRFHTAVSRPRAAACLIDGEPT